MAKKHEKNKKWVVWLLMLVLFAVAAGVVYLVWNACFGGKDEGQDFGVTTEVDGEEEPQGQGEEAGMIEKPKVVQYDGDDPNGSDGLSGVITYAGVTDDYLTIRVNIDQYLTDGECKLSVLSGDSLIHEEVVEIVSGPSSSSCNGFDVPVGIIGGGRFEVVVDFESDERRGAVREGVEV